MMIIRKVIIVFMSLLLLNSCTSDQSKESTHMVDSLAIEDTVTVVPLKDSTSGVKEFNFAEIVRALPENEKELEYNETFFTDYEAIQEAKSKMIKKACTKGMFPESVNCQDTVYFAWKMPVHEFMLVCFMTIDWNAKGPSVLYHLMTVENSTGERIECLPNWAASYSFAVENPDGGTSAGAQYVPGSITNSPVLRISTQDEKGSDITFELSPDGRFVEPYAQFDAETNLQ
jgi:hypothetical protein